MRFDTLATATAGIVLPFTSWIPSSADLQDPEFWVRVAVAILAPVLTLVVHRLIAAGARAAREGAKQLRAARNAMLSDADPSNDAQGHLLGFAADALDAGAEGLETGKGARAAHAVARETLDDGAAGLKRR
jgi:hypothetical protein